MLAPACAALPCSVFWIVGATARHLLLGSQCGWVVRSFGGRQVQASTQQPPTLLASTNLQAQLMPQSQAISDAMTHLRNDALQATEESGACCLRDCYPQRSPRWGNLALHC